MKFSAVKLEKTESVYNGEFLWSHRKEHFINSPGKTETFLKWNFPVFGDSAFTDFNLLYSVILVKMKPVYIGILI